MNKARKQLLLSLAVLFLVNICIITLAERAQAATYRRGSSGAVVRTIQDTLSRWGYYTDATDGIYSARTEEAVRTFQRQNSLTADGVAGGETLSALGLPASSAGSARDLTLDLLARVISAEAGAEPYAAQVAVGAVILNRVKHPAFPATIPGVLYQPGAFSSITTGLSDTPVTESAVRAAGEALNGSDPSGGALYYFNPKNDAHSWGLGRPLIKIIGNYRFCG